MNEQMQTIVKVIEDRFGILNSEFRGQVKLMVPAEKIVEVCRLLRDELEFERLSGITAVDYWPDMEPRFHVIYEMHSIKKNLRLEMRVPLPGKNPAVPTISEVYPSANWYERELWDMFGIRSERHPDLRRILMPEDWEGFPLRKDYPLGYEEVRFTFNEKDIEARKPSPKE